MPTIDRPTLKVLITRVVQYAKKQVSDDAYFRVFSRFIRLFYGHASVADLQNRTMQELYGMVHSHWQMMQKCHDKIEPCEVRIFNPEQQIDGWHSDNTVVQVIVKDMPFIVDSLKMELQRLAYPIQLMIYMGGMQVARASDHSVVKVAPYHAPDKKDVMHCEAPVYIEIDRISDPDVLLNLHENLIRVLRDVKLTVDDWNIMQLRVTESINYLESWKKKNILSQKEVDESISFLRWLLDGQFTFLGIRDYKVVESNDQKALKLIKDSGLGVLRDTTDSKIYREFSKMPEQARESLLSPKQLLVISKTNTISSVHRSAYTDYIGIKKFNDQGVLIGERRIIGLFTSTAYHTHPNLIPFLRLKVASILKKSRLPERSHGGKDLMHILETFPRDDLFQGTVEDLFNIAIGMLNMQDRKKVRIFVREDAHARYLSCFVFVPRNKFSEQLVYTIQNILMKKFKGIDASNSTFFYTPVLTRIHYSIRLSSKTVRYNTEELEAKLVEVTKTWEDEYKECAINYFGHHRALDLIKKYSNAFSASYREDFSPMTAVFDIQHMEALEGDSLGMSLYRPVESQPNEIKFKLFRKSETVPLSDALPILENMGLRVIGEESYEMDFSSHASIWLNDFLMTYPENVELDINEIREIFQEAFSSIWTRKTESDSLNALVIKSVLNWREVAVVRAYIKYLKQSGFTYSFEYIAETFVKYPKISKLLLQYFDVVFSPNKVNERHRNDERQLEVDILNAIEAVVLLDEDRIFRRILEVIKATVRTNFYQKDRLGEFKTIMSFKLMPHQISEMPKPSPQYEIFVYSPDVKGVHLRMAKVARGGIRWSDRREDFRTEVLGLMKAQQVKNAVIVPAGAKGGFFPKNLPLRGTRDEIMKTAIACYKGFIQALLDITDNLNEHEVLPPKDVVRYDDDDPYLVVAADKGTSTFSDIANQIAIENNFWLGDAFASGGSSGYDHKKMGITARGAWVSVERHFQGLGVDVNHNEITVAGIGDMSGDVFGNGMLISPHLKLVAAFNHQHIFLDPDPNPEVSFLERKRLFNLPRSSWTDYQASFISLGGGVYSRDAKSILLTPQVQALLEIEKEKVTPNELIRAILRSPVDLIWNGGIGTYVKSSKETHLMVGDRTNDGLRVDGNEVRARVIAEGGNLGCTQLGRVEYALNGGLINTDFIDNSAGVDCSDHEVNIKILLSSVISAGELNEKQRNQLLASMKHEVAQLVLESNYLQNESVSLLTHTSPTQINLYMSYIKACEAEGKLDRALEYLPDDQTLMDRRANNIGLTKPEISILFSYSKIILKEQVLHSDLMQDSALFHYTDLAFPKNLRKKYRPYIINHRLHNEILATQLSNHIVGTMGITFIHQMLDETGATVPTIVRAFISAFEIFDVAEIHQEIDELDYKIDMSIQYQMLNETIRLIRRATRWMLRNWRDRVDIHKTITHFKPHVKGMFKRLPTLLLGSEIDYFEEHSANLIAKGVPSDLAHRMAGARAVYHALNVIRTSTTQHEEVYGVAKIYFTLVDLLDLHWFRDKINDQPVTHHWSILAKSALKADLDWVMRELTTAVIRTNVPVKSINAKINAWMSFHQNSIDRWNKILTELHNEDITDFSIFSVAIRELFDLIQASAQQELKV